VGEVSHSVPPPHPYTHPSHHFSSDTRRGDNIDVVEEEDGEDDDVVAVVVFNRISMEVELLLGDTVAAVRTESWTIFLTFTPSSISTSSWFRSELLLSSFNFMIELSGTSVHVELHDGDVELLV
jgi:hypothetical protein